MTQAYALFSANRQSPWSLKTFQDGLNNDLSAIVCINHTLVGFIIVSIVLDHAEIEDICIDAEKRNQGIASLLVQHTFQMAKAQGINEVFLEVADNNHSAIAVYKRLGFSQIGKRKAYYKSSPQQDGRKDQNIDALLMQKSLS